MSLGKLGTNEAYAASHGGDAFGLQPRLVKVEYPMGETPQLAATFINQFLKVRGDFPTDFRLLGWFTLQISHGKVKWWALFSQSLRTH